jgi:hypothetical protein
MKANVAKRGLLGLLGALLIAGCATTNYDLTASSKVPAASGSLKISTGDNGNSRLTIQVRNLAEPSKLTPDASAYVVWVAPVDGGAAQNVGSLQVYGDDLSGSLSTVTPLHDFRVSITAEALAQASAPSGAEVLSVTVHR